MSESGIPTIGIALVGYGFMGKAHSLALRALPGLDATGIPEPRLISICGRSREAVERARAQYGWSEAVTDWRHQVSDERVEVFDNAAPNALHGEPTLAAIGNGKHAFCEKPLATSPTEARDLWLHAERAQVVHMCGFNYRFMPAVRLARELLEAGDLGEPTHFRARFLASSALRNDQKRTWRFDRSIAGSGALADIGSHIIDLGRYLVGEPVRVSATMRTYIPSREDGLVDVDDAFSAVIEYDCGAIGTLEASRVAGRRSNACTFEVDGTRGSLGFDGERLNELQLTTDRKRACRIEVTDPDHPFMGLWWPSPGHSIGWGDSFTHEMRHLLAAVKGEGSVTPHGASFEDGYRCAEVCDAIQRAADTGTTQTVTPTRPPAQLVKRAR